MGRMSFLTLLKLKKTHDNNKKKKDYNCCFIKRAKKTIPGFLIALKTSGNH